AGYPVGPLQLLDELTLTLPLKLDAEARAALGDAYVEPAGVAVLKAMVEQHGRTGKSGGAGFYDYVDDEGGSRKRAGLWPGLAEHFPVATTLDVTDVQERMLVVEALETVKCLDEGILTSVPDANIGAIFGIGFPPWTGGPIQYIDGYEGGTTGFVARCKAL